MQTDRTAFIGIPNTCFHCGDTSAEIICPDCEARIQAANAAAEQRIAEQAIQRRLDIFREKVGDYADTVKDLLPATAARRIAGEYYVGGKAGLTISGPGDTGKTRACVWIAGQEVLAGRWVDFRQCGDLRREIGDHARHGEFGRAVKPLMQCDVLILDDFGNHEFTRTTEEFFLSLLERRTNGGRRNFITSQYTSAQLRKLFTTEQMADAILRRIGRQYATLVNTADNTVTHHQ